jgi:hypothetical protein
MLAIGLVALLLGCVLGAGVMAVYDRTGNTGRFGDGFRDGRPGHSRQDDRGVPGRPGDGPLGR